MDDDEYEWYAFPSLQAQADRHNADVELLHAQRRWLVSEIVHNVRTISLAVAVILFGIADLIWGPWLWAPFVTVSAALYLLPKMIRGMQRWHRFKRMGRS